MAEQQKSGAPEYDPYDPESLRASQDFENTTQIKKILTKVDVRKPNRFEFVRVSTDPKYRAESVALLDMKQERETYLILPHLTNLLPTRFDLHDIYTAVTKQGVVFLWPVKRAESGSIGASWAESMCKAVELAKTSWVRIEANRHNSCYDISVALNHSPEPVWPSETMRDLLKLAFGNYTVDREDHSLILRLLGAE